MAKNITTVLFTNRLMTEMGRFMNSKQGENISLSNFPLLRINDLHQICIIFSFILALPGDAADQLDGTLETLPLAMARGTGVTTGTE